MSGTAFAVLLVLTLAIWNLLVGDAILRRIRMRGLDPLGVYLFAAAIGLGVSASVVALLGVSGVFLPMVVLLVPGVAFALTFRSKEHPLRDATAAVFDASKPHRLDYATTALGAAILCLAFLTLTGSLAPPTSNEWDSLAYHLAVPKVWLRDGRMHMLPYDNHAGFPMLTEMLYGFGLSSGKVVAAKLIHWLYGMLCALTCYWAGRHWVSRKAGLLAAALFLACPVVGWEATTAYIDLAAALYVALSVFTFARFVESRGGGERGSGRGETEVAPSPHLPLTPSSSWLVLSGICGGLACGVKMTMIATSGMLVLWAVGLALRRMASWKDVGLLTALIFVIGAPWYIKTWIWTGNPFYPFAYSLFGGHWWGAAQAAQYAAEQGRFGIGKTLYGLWVAPWSTTYYAQYYANPPAAYHGALEMAGRPNAFPALFGTLGIGVIGFLPLWLLRPGNGGRTASRAPAWFAVYGGVFLLIWFALTHQTRYMIPVLPIVLIPAVAGARAFWHEGRWWRVGIGTFSALAIVWGILPLYAYVQPSFAVAWGGESQDAYLSNTEPIYNVSKAINAGLPADAKVLMLNEVRGFYIDRRYQWGDASQNTLIPWDNLKSPDQIDAALRAQGITHVLVNWGPRAAPSERWPELAKSAIARGDWREDLREKSFVVYTVVPPR